ncbi:MAG: FecR domain-containing protein [Gammaproteobacteria bacterium]|nr:FecR domain-containing protein [Gammaproteobacteria bacterium]
MKINYKKRCFCLVIATSLFMTGVVSANVGKVLIAIGDVKAQREQLVQLHRNSILQEKDIIITGAKARAQLLMIDDAKIAIKPSSEFSLDEYKLAQQSTNKSNLVGSNKSSVTMSLLKGGFRTISGAIGSGSDKNEYLVKTPIATIGIRGTDYSILLCDASCASLESSENMAPGLYIGVSSGGIQISNALGQLLLTEGQYSYVASINKNPVRIVTPPLFLMSDTTNPLVKNDNIESSGTIVESDDIEEPLEDDILQDDNLSISITGSDDITGYDDIIVSIDGIGSDGYPVEVDNINYDFSNLYSIGLSGLFGTDNGYSTVSETPVDSIDTSEIGLLEFYTLSPETGIGTLYSIADSILINVGYDELSGLSWGRWGGNFMTSTSVDGNVSEIALVNSSIHWLVNNFQEDQTLPISGSASFQLVGNTDPTNNIGDVGILGSASFYVDFTNQTVSNSLNLGIAGSVWSATGSGTIVTGTSWFEGVYSSVVIDDVENGTGDFSGMFSSLQTDGIPSGAGLNYVLRSGAGEIVNGVLVFGYRSGPQ